MLLPKHCCLAHAESSYLWSFTFIYHPLILPYAETLGCTEHSISFYFKSSQPLYWLKEYVVSPLDAFFLWMFDFLDPSTLNFHPPLDNPWSQLDFILTYIFITSNIIKFQILISDRSLHLFQPLTSLLSLYSMYLHHGFEFSTPPSFFSHCTASVHFLWIPASMVSHINILLEVYTFELVVWIAFI